MARAKAVGTLLLFVSALAGSARADTIRLGTASYTTSGTFDCRDRVVCTAEGTNSVTIASGSDFATLTFTGANETIDITNTALPATLGSFTLDASDGFLFPTKWNNPELPILRFFFSFDQSTGAHNSRLFEFGPGGRPTIGIQVGSSYMTLPGPGHGYDHTVYTFSPFPFTLAPGNTDFTAQVGATPEPASMILLGTGLAGAALARRRRRRGRRPDVGCRRSDVGCRR